MIYPVTSDFDSPLMPTGVYTSETFAYEAVARLKDADKALVGSRLHTHNQEME